MVEASSEIGQKIARATLIFCNREEKKGTHTIGITDAEKIQKILMEQGEHVPFEDVQNVLKQFLSK